MTGIVGRADLLSCVLFLLSLLFFHFSAAATNISTSNSMITKVRTVLIKIYETLGMEPQNEANCPPKCRGPLFFSKFMPFVPILYQCPRGSINNINFSEPGYKASYIALGIMELLGYLLHCCIFLQLFFSLLCGAAAMLCKEHGATVLGVCMLYDILILNRDNIIRYKEYPNQIMFCTVILSNIFFVCVWLTNGMLHHRK